MTHGLYCRKLLVVDEATDNKSKGASIARLSLAPDNDVTYDVGSGLLNLQQSLLTRLLLCEFLPFHRDSNSMDVFPVVQE